MQQDTILKKKNHFFSGSQSQEVKAHPLLWGRLSSFCFHVSSALRRGCGRDLPGSSLGKGFIPPAPGLVLLPRGVTNADNAGLCILKFSSWGSTCLVQPCNRFAEPGAASQSILRLQAGLNQGLSGNRWWRGREEGAAPGRWRRGPCVQL